MLLVPTHALHAEEEEAPAAPGYDWYTGSDIAFSSIDFAYQNLDEKSRPVALSLRAGVQFHPNVALELRYSFGIQDEKLYAPVSGTTPGTRDSLTGEVALDSVTSFLVKGILPTQLPMRPYALLGYSQTETTLTGFVGTGTSTRTAVNPVISDSGVSIGFGLDLLLKARYSLSVEYLSAVSSSESSISSFNFGLNYHW